jgi:hypothetical protein
MKVAWYYIVVMFISWPYDVTGTFCKHIMCEITLWCHMDTLKYLFVYCTRLK